MMVSFLCLYTSPPSKLCAKLYVIYRYCVVTHEYILHTAYIAICRGVSLHIGYIGSWEGRGYRV